MNNAVSSLDTPIVRFLIVDDEEPVRRLLRQQVAHTVSIPCIVDVAATAEQARQRLELETYDVVICDKCMPQVDGLTFLREVREQHPRVIAGLISGYADLGDVTDALNRSGIAFFLAKPWRQNQLQVVLHSILERLRVQRERDSLVTCLERSNEHIRELNKSLESSVAEVVKLLGDVLEISAPPLSHHVQHAARLASLCAAALDWDQDARRQVESAALLHDIGLLGAPGSLWHTPPQHLAGEARHTWRRHTRTGAHMLQAIPALKRVRSMVLTHHENLDGTGLLGLDGAKLGPENRLLRICAFYSEHTALLGYGIEDVLSVLKGRADQWFDSQLLRTFFDVQASIQGRQRQMVPVGQLRVGMELARDLVSPGGRLLMANGAILTRNNLRRLRLHPQLPADWEVCVLSRGAARQAS